MLSKKVLDALREQFHEEFGELSERDGYIQRVKADAFALIGSMAPNDRRLEVEVDDAITGIVSASSLLGFYIGLKTGADVERYISDSRLPEQILKGIRNLKNNLVSTPVISRDNGGLSVWVYCLLSASKDRLYAL